MTSAAATAFTHRDKLAVFAWLALAWTFRGGDGPYFIGTLITCLWAWLNLKEQHTTRLLSSTVSKALVFWILSILAGLCWRLFEPSALPPYAAIAYFNWLSLLVFVPVAGLLYHNQSRLYWLLLLPALAVVFRIIAHVSIDTWQSDLFGRGFNGFGLHHVRFGMQASLALISLLALGPALVRSLSSYRWPATAGLIFSGALLTQALLRCGSRSGLICLIVGITVLVWCNRSAITQQLMTRRGAITSAFLLVLAVGAISLNAEQLQKRFVVGAFQQANYTLNLEEIPRDKDMFFGRRLHLSVFGLEHWQNKPLLGHGPGSVEALLDADVDFHVHPHLHNMYVQILVEIGTFGAISWLVLSIALLTEVYRFGRRMERPALLNFFWAFSLALAVWSLQSAPIHQAAWRFAVVLILALAGTISFLGRQQMKAVPPFKKE